MAAKILTLNAKKQASARNIRDVYNDAMLTRTQQRQLDKGGFIGPIDKLIHDNLYRTNTPSALLAELSEALGWFREATSHMLAEDLYTQVDDACNSLANVAYDLKKFGK